MPLKSARATRKNLAGHKIRIERTYSGCKTEMRLLEHDVRYDGRILWWRDCLS